MKGIVIAMLGLLGALPAWAAAEDGTLSRIGIKGGINLGRLNDGGQNAQSFESVFGGSWDQGLRLGVVIGAFGEFELSPAWILRPEVLYTMKGESYDQEGGSGASVKLELDYLEVPFLVLYRFPTTGTIRPGLFAGPAVALEVHSDVTVEGDDISVPRTKNFDVSMVAGFEVQFRGRYYLEARVWNGFTDLNDTGFGEAIRNQGGSVMVGLSWDQSRD